MLQCGKYFYYCLFTVVTCKVLEFGCHQKNWKSCPWLWTFCCLFFSQPDLHLLKLLKWFNVSVTLIVSFSEYQAIRITGYFRPCHFDFFLPFACSSVMWQLMKRIEIHMMYEKLILVPKLKLLIWGSLGNENYGSFLFSFKAGEKIQYSITGDGSGICRLVGAQHSVRHVWHYPHGCLA